jgi:hypothetical protein
MRPYPVEAICLLQPRHEFFEMLISLLPGDESTFDANQDRHHTKPRTARCHNVFIVFRIYIIRVKPLTRCTRSWLCAIPEVLEGFVLDQGEKRIITYLFFRVSRNGFLFLRRRT